MVGIAGSSGFIGSYLSKHLASKELGSLRLLARNSANHQNHAGAELLHGDLLSRADCERFAHGLQTIYYLAHNNSPVDSVVTCQATCESGAVVEICTDIQHLGAKPHIVYFSSGGAFTLEADQSLSGGDPRGLCPPMASKKLRRQRHAIGFAQALLTATVLQLKCRTGELLSLVPVAG